MATHPGNRAILLRASRRRRCLVQPPPVLCRGCALVSPPYFFLVLFSPLPRSESRSSPFHFQGERKREVEGMHSAIPFSRISFAAAPAVVRPTSIEVIVLRVTTSSEVAYLGLVLPFAPAAPVPGVDPVTPPLRISTDAVSRLL